LIPLPALFRQELCRVARQDYEKEIQRGIELHARIMAERAQSRYRKHYGLCRETLNAVVDFACKIAEYRQLTER